MEKDMIANDYKSGNMSITYPDVILEVLSLLLKCLHRKAVSLFA